MDAVMATVRGAAPGIEAAHVLGEGRAADVLLAASGGAALLVVGAHRRGGHAGRRLGPLHRAALRHAPCPVAIVPHI
ncbi:universal stress protein [Streptomyces sp. TS71-3]|uniref:universal stress protein n=1 Tax=Streptomyces sp. TS71-3 TaxID=2733862 RepID=UPI0035ABF0C2